MRLGTPISSTWFLLWLIGALLVSTLIYRCSGNVPPPLVNTLSAFGYVVTTIYVILRVAFWMSIGVTCFLLYCLFPLRILPWAGGACLIRFLTTLGFQWMNHKILLSNSVAASLD